MTEIADGWEVVSRRSNPASLWSALLRIVLMVPEAPAYGVATWTVRQTATGVVRKVSALSEQEARNKIELGIFDDE